MASLDVLKEFDDVEPIMGDVEGPCSIEYSAFFGKLIGYFRRCSQLGEISERVYRLTSEIIQMAPAYISAWVVRQRCIAQLNLDVDKEYLFLEELRGINAKCYQTWMHRTFLIKTFGIRSIEKEKTFCDSYIKDDHKNIHSWTYRTWLIGEFNAYEGELEYASKYIDIDVFNNSAWSYRYNIFTHLYGLPELEAELEYVMSKLELAPHNDACWNYLQGLMQRYEEYQFNDVVYSIKTLIKTHRDASSAYYTLILYYRQQFQLDELKICLEYLAVLKQIDAVRIHYWEKLERDIHRDIAFMEEINS